MALFGSVGQSAGNWDSDSRLYVGPIASHTDHQEVRDLFDRFGKIEAIDLKRGFCFVQFSDRRDAKDAAAEMDGRSLPGTAIKLTVTLSKRGDKQKLSKCYNCGRSGHLSRDCDLVDGASPGAAPKSRSGRHRSRSPPRHSRGSGAGDRRRHYSRSRSRSRGRDRRGGSPGRYSRRSRSRSASGSRREQPSQRRRSRSRGRQQESQRLQQQQRRRDSRSPSPRKERRPSDRRRD